MNRQHKLVIIGAGISGITCALLFQHLGFEVTIYSKDDPRLPGSSPSFASLFPSASVIPHSVFSDNLASLFTASMAWWELLLKESFPGVTIHKHYELFSSPKATPFYSKQVSNFEHFEDFKDQWHPSHPGVSIQSGWRFDCFFADWPQYYPVLVQKFLNQGGELIIRKLHSSELAELGAGVIVNCSGMGAASLFNETGKHSKIYRGHLLHVFGAPLLQNPEGCTVSYNFTPGAGLYSDKNGHPCDVYCYPRKDGWILGGSRQKGSTDDEGNWTGEQNTEPLASIDGNLFPAQIEELNRIIIRNSFNIDMNQFPNRELKVGYRYIRSEQQGLRIEAEKLKNKLVIHNYGHGGAGVTLSWGCAEKVLQLFCEHTGTDKPHSDLLRKLIDC